MLLVGFSTVGWICLGGCKVIFTSISHLGARVQPPVDLCTYTQARKRLRHYESACREGGGEKEAWREGGRERGSEEERERERETVRLLLGEEEEEEEVIWNRTRTEELFRHLECTT